MSRRHGGSALRRYGSLLTTVLLITAGVLLAAGCGATRLPCAGQCGAPYQLDVVFRPGATRTAATAALRTCQANPTVVRLGRLHPWHSGQLAPRLSATVFTRSMAGGNTASLARCLRASDAVLGVGFPD
jgi:hypothetical protein